MAEQENYRTTVRYYNTNQKRDQRYITIELPEGSVLEPNDQVTVSITKVNREFISTSSGENAERLTAGSIMRQMCIGQTATFNIDQWTTLRTIATQIKQMYGSTYTVRRDRQHPENVIVTRVS